MKGTHKSWPYTPKDFQDLYLNTPMMMHSIDADGVLLSVSDFWLERLDYNRDEVVGKKLTEFFTAKSKDFAEETILPHFSSGSRCLVDLRR